MTLSQIVQLLIAIPKIISFIRDFSKLLQNAKDEKKAKRAEDSTAALNNATTRGEIEKAADDWIDSH